MGLFDTWHVWLAACPIRIQDLSSKCLVCICLRGGWGRFNSTFGKGCFILGSPKKTVLKRALKKNLVSLILEARSNRWPAGIWYRRLETGVRKDMSEHDRTFWYSMPFSEKSTVFKSESETDRSVATHFEVVCATCIGCGMGPLATWILIVICLPSHSIEPSLCEPSRGFLALRIRSSSPLYKTECGKM